MAYLQSESKVCVCVVYNKTKHGTCVLDAKIHEDTACTGAFVLISANQEQRFVRG